MLAKKYYAQRGSSRKNTNTNAVAQSSSTRTKYMRRWTYGVAKVAPERNASDKIEIKKYEELKCGAESGNNPRKENGIICNARQNNDKCSRPSIFKEAVPTQTDNQYVDNKVAKNVCTRDDFWGTLPRANNCKHA